MSTRRRRIAVAVLFVAGIVAGSYAWYQHWRNDVVALPDIDEIAEMKVWAEGLNSQALEDFENQNLEQLEFVVPKEHWRKILDSLRPYHRARVYKFGNTPCWIQIRLHDGREMKVHFLLFTGDDEVFFALGPQGKQHAGGIKRDLYSAVKSAAKASEQKRKPN